VTERPLGHLKQVLGLAFGLAVLVGNTIGMGILRTPGEVAAAVPSAALFMLLWALGAAYALLGALSVAELGAMHPRSGGLFPLVHRGLGPFAGFVSGWTDWVATCGSLAAVALVLGEYLGPLLPGVTTTPAPVAAAAVLGIALLQWRGIRIGDVAQQITSLAKAVGLVGLAAAALVVSPETGGGARERSGWVRPRRRDRGRSPIRHLHLRRLDRPDLLRRRGEGPWTGHPAVDDRRGDPRARDLPRPQPRVPEGRTARPDGR
jgi:amino acid transporter